MRKPFWKKGDLKLIELDFFGGKKQTKQNRAIRTVDNETSIKGI